MTKTITMPTWLAVLLLTAAWWFFALVIYVGVKDFIEDRRWNREHDL